MQIDERTRISFGLEGQPVDRAMLKVSVTEAKNRLSALLDGIERGEDVIITRRGRPIARLTGLSPGHNAVRARQEIADLRAASRNLTLGGVSVRDLIDERRR